MQIYYFRWVPIFFKDGGWRIVEITTTVVVTMQVLLAVRMISAKKASDMVPHLALQMIAFLIWAGTAITTGILILYIFFVSGENGKKASIPINSEW